MRSIVMPTDTAPCGGLRREDAPNPLYVLRPLIESLAGQWKELIPASLRRAFISWIYRVIAPDKGIDPRRIGVEDLAEVQVMLRTRIKQWEQELIQQGIEKGIEKGREEGVLSGEAKLLRRQLELKFGTLSDTLRMKIDQASRDELDQWGLKILTAKTLEEVFR